jgi:sulfite reductase alpha subunit-like flavoprotein
MSKYFNESFEIFGAERVFKYGEGNAEGNKTEDDFNEWKADIWKELIDFYASRETEEEKKINLIEKEVEVKVKSKEPEFPLIVKILEESDKTERSESV